MHAGACRYQFEHVPAELTQRHFTRISGGAGSEGAPKAVLRATVEVAGSVLYAAIGRKGAGVDAGPVAKRLVSGAFPSRVHAVHFD